MLIYFTSKLISSVVAFLYPGYASYKTLSQRPASEADLERWLMYWSVLGCIVGVEYVAEWLISWIPLYYPIKTIFLLYLSLPQTQGSSYLYINYLQPFFHAHESDIDATIVKMKTRVYTYVQKRIHWVWDQVVSSLGQAADPSAAASQGAQSGAGSDSAPPPSLGDPASGPAQLISGFWRSYGPTIIASGATILRQTAQASQGAAAVGGASLLNLAAATGSGGTGGVVTAQRVQTSSREPHSVRDRRRALEAELASLHEEDVPSQYSPPSSSSSNTSLHQQPAQGSSVIPTSQGSTGYLPISGSEADLRSRVSQFEEVEVPSDIEGYEVDPTRTDSTDSSSSRPQQARRTSWFGWGASGAPATAVAEKNKSE